MKAMLVAAAVLACSQAHAAIYTTTPVYKTPEQAKADADAFFRRLYQPPDIYQGPRAQPTFEDQMRRIIREELEQQRR